MPKENQSDGRAHDCDHEQIFCAHGHIHEHRKSRVIGVRMAMCTSKPIIGKDAGGGLPMPEFFGPFSRSAFLVNKISLFLQKCQCIELLTVF